MKIYHLTPAYSVYLFSVFKTRKIKKEFHNTNIMSLRRKEILVVDDSETNLLLLQAVLEDEGYHVVVMEDSSKAVEYIHKNKPDLVLLDLLMPDLDGFGFMQKLGNGTGNFASPVIVVTAYANSENNRRARELGALDVINKPINISSFIMKVNKIVN